MSAAHQGSVVTTKTRKRLSKALRGRTFSLEHRQKLSRAFKISLQGNQNVKGKTWKLDPEIVERNRQRALEDYRSGRRTVPPNAGNGRTGFRADIRHFVRSTWEANVARILILHNVEYEYECCAFPTSLGSYRPDFLLVELNVFLEIKGYDTPKHQAKRALADIPLILVGSEAYHLLETQFRNRIPEWE